MPRVTGRSLTSVYVTTIDGIDIFEQGAAAEIRTGVDPNGATPDIEIEVGLGYLADELWFDPDPWSRLATAPIDRIDAMSVMLHELGHALAYNGWMDGCTGELPGNYASTFDQWVAFDGSDLVFNGPAATVAWGSMPEVTICNPFHWGNPGLAMMSDRPPQAGPTERGPIEAPEVVARWAPPSANAPEHSSGGLSLLDELMNGVVFYYGTRYTISTLDRGLLADAGLDPNPCRSDADGDDVVGVVDLLGLLARWGTCLSPCAPDLDLDGTVTVSDLLDLLATWGPCG